MSKTPREIAEMLFSAVEEYQFLPEIIRKSPLTRLVYVDRLETGVKNIMRLEREACASIASTAGGRMNS